MISTADIEKLATLARISVSESEKEGVRKDIEGILAYVGQIQGVSSQTAKPQNHADITRNNAEQMLLVNVMREDTNPHESGIFTEALLSVAPQREGEYIRVKKIL